MRKPTSSCVIILGSALLAAFGFGASTVPMHPNGPTGRWTDTTEAQAVSRSSRRSIDESDVEKAVHSAAQYLVRAARPNGQFEYLVNLDPHAEVKPAYNVLRHAGSLYALAAYYQRYEAADVLPVLRQQAEFLIRSCIRPVPAHPQLSAVWSDPEYTGDSLPVAKLGGTGLGLVALSSVEMVTQGTIEREELRRLGRFIVFMQKRDGSFYSKYLPQQGGPSDRWKSLYYPGEAILGLVMLHEWDPSPSWIEAAAAGMASLARSREGRQEVEADHWALLATARLLPFHEQFEHIVTVEQLKAHAEQICRSMLAKRVVHHGQSPLLGCFSKDGRTCPTSTRLEGLQAAMSFLDDDPGLRAPASRAIEAGIDFLLRAQVQTGPHAGAIGRALEIRSRPDHHDLRRRATEVRIDYVQHALCAWMQFADSRDKRCEEAGQAIR